MKPSVTHVARSRSTRVMKLGRALLRRLRKSGFDEGAGRLRLRLGTAVARLGALADENPDQDGVLDAVIQARLYVLHLVDQMDAMAEAARGREAGPAPVTDGG